MAKGNWKIVSNPDEARGRLSRARGFLQQARRTAQEDERNPGVADTVMVLCVHAAIAYTDALTIAKAGIQNTQDHQTVPTVLQKALGKSADAQQISRLKRLLQRKAEIEYDHRHMSSDQAGHYLEQAERFAEWAERLLN
jgi:hypothetical protein